MSFYPRTKFGRAGLEEELRWRFLYAEGEVSGVRSTWREEYVPVGGRPQGADGRCIAAARRMRRVDTALARLPQQQREALRAVYGMPNRLAAFGPAGNLVPLVAQQWHTASRSRRAFSAWLLREVSKAQRGTGSPRLVRELGAAADALCAKALEAYGGTRQGIRGLAAA